MAAKKLHNIILKEIDKLIKKAQKKKKLFYVGKQRKRGMWQKKLRLLEKELQQLQAESKRLLRAYTSKKINLSEFGEEKDRLDDEIFKKQEVVNELSGKLGNQDEIKMAEKRFLLMLKNFRKDFDKLDIKKQKDLISNLIESVIVGKNGRIDIKYRI